jgi:hypothetical protein
MGVVMGISLNERLRDRFEARLQEQAQSMDKDEHDRSQPGRAFWFIDGCLMAIMAGPALLAFGLVVTTYKIWKTRVPLTIKILILAVAVVANLIAVAIMIVDSW